jgi:hypothetical protein
MTKGQGPSTQAGDPVPMPQVRATAPLKEQEDVLSVQLSGHAGSASR